MLESQRFNDGLDQLRESLQREKNTEQVMLGGSVTVTAGLSVGYLVWLTRSGALLGAALSALPAWRFVDPLPILAHAGTPDDEDDETLASIVEGASPLEDAPDDDASTKTNEHEVES
jgi:hypothetical protein